MRTTSSPGSIVSETSTTAGRASSPLSNRLRDVVEPDLGRRVRRAGERLLLVLDGAPPLVRVEESRSRGVDEGGSRTMRP